MKIYLLITLICLSLLGCSSTKQTHHTKPQSSPQQKAKPITKTNSTKKNPIAVTFFTHGKKPTKPYTIVGKQTVSKYNGTGIKRQEAHIRDVMRDYAANIGGDAVINITHDDQTITGVVIAYLDDVTKPKTG